MIRKLLIALLAMSSMAAEAQPTGGYRRPRIRFDAANPDVHDPVMAREDGKYYLFATGMQLAELTSRDLKLWEKGGEVMPEVPQWAMDAVQGYRGHTWAPDIQRVGDTWYMYYSCSAFGKNTSAIGLMTNRTLNPDSADYHWEDRGMVVQSIPGKTDWNAIDPNMILDEKGQPWLTWGSFWDGIQLVRLGKDFRTPVGKPKTVARRYAKKGMDQAVSAEDRERANQAPAAGANAIEAPFLIRQGDYYYLFASWDYCCKGANSNYKTVVGRSRKITGPYLDKEGRDMALGGGTIVAGPDEDYYGIGHCSAYEFDGQWYFLAHGYAVANNGASKLFLRKMHFDADSWPMLEDSRKQRFSSTYDVVQAMLADTKPACAFRPTMKPEEMTAWQESVSRGMAELMHHPAVPEKVEATLISREQCDGYTRDRWEFSPLPHCTAQFTVLLPNVSSPQPAVMCIPGSGMTMDNVCDTLDRAYCFATRIAREGFVAVAVENACAGTMRDTTLAGFDYDTPSRILLELGWSWLGYTSYIDRLILQWMRQQSFINKERICVAGFSLGTEPLMVLGALDKDIHSFVYNDFLCNTQERAKVLTSGGGQYQRPFPNSIRHLIPGWWRYFNFPDIVASLAPRPVILTEGGMDRDFDLVRRAYQLSGHPENAELHHYAKFEPDSMRTYLGQMPADIDRDTYFRLANVDTKNHYFKSEHIIPWLKRVLK